MAKVKARPALKGGFGSGPSDEQIIKTIMSSRSLEDILIEREKYQSDYPYRKARPFTYEDMMTAPEGHVRTDFDKHVHKGTGQTQQILVMGQCGHWSVVVIKNFFLHSGKTKLDFQFAIWTGERLAFHPGEVKNQIVSQLGMDVFLEYREMVKGQLPQFRKFLQEEITPLLPGPMSSVTCDASSERVCKQLGLVVRSHVAIWIPGRI